MPEYHAHETSHRDPVLGIGGTHDTAFMYPTHTPIGPFQRGAIAVASAFGAAFK